MPTTPRHRIRTAALAVLIAPLLVLGLVPGTASADVNDRDPERVVVAPGSTDAGRAGAARRAPASIDSDVYAYASSPTGRIYFAVAGHLKLSLRSGSSTKYGGTFVDHVGGAATKASADASDPAAPTIKLKGKNGSFAFSVTSGFGSAFSSGTATQVPSKIGFKAKDVVFVGSQHTLKTATYSVVLTERSGPANRPLEYAGSLTIAYDANSRISGGQITVTDRKGRNVTHSLKNSGFFSTSYFYTVAKVDKTSMGLTGTFSGSSFSGFGFAGSGITTSQWVISGTP